MRSAAAPYSPANTVVSSGCAIDPAWISRAAAVRLTSTESQPDLRALGTCLAVAIAASAACAQTGLGQRQNLIDLVGDAIGHVRDKGAQVHGNET